MKNLIALVVLIVGLSVVAVAQSSWWRSADASLAMSTGQEKTRSPQSVSIDIPAKSAVGDVTSTIHFTGELILMGLLGAIGFLGRRQLKTIDDKTKEYDKHLKECNKKAVVQATFEGDVKTSHASMSGKIEALDGRCERMEKITERIDSKLDRLLER